MERGAEPAPTGAGRSLPELRVAAPMAEQLRRGHPWLYANKVAAGQGDEARFVELIDPRSSPLGFALFDPHSPIAIRLLSQPHEPAPGPALWSSRLGRAVRLRQQLFDERQSNAYRVCNGEGDGLPGVVVDRYADVAVLRLDTAAWLPWLGELVDALRASLPLGHGYLKGVRAQKGEEHHRALWGSVPSEPVTVLEHGMHMLADLQHGQKTGLFLDQRENRALIRSLARGRRVVNLFSYTAGFSLAAAMGGASRTVSVDLAKPALELARRSFELNGIALESHDFVAADVFDWLGSGSPASAFDVAIVDPPSMAASKAALATAIPAYVRLNAASMRLLGPEGLLATASCSSHVDRALFLEMLGQAAREARRRLTVLELREQPADHPSPLHFPEGRYLQFALCRVD